MSSEPRAGASLAAVAEFRLVTADLPRLRRFYTETLGFAADGPEQAIATGRDGAAGRARRGAAADGCGLARRSCRSTSSTLRGAVSGPWRRRLAVVPAPGPGGGRHGGGLSPGARGGCRSARVARSILPQSSGGVHAFKFRDPDGHPLELLQFPPDSRPAAWQGRSADAGQIGLGIDHSAISVADADASPSFYRSLGLEPGERTLNRGPEQQRLDDLAGVEVAVVPMQPASGTPHLELLGYHVPRGAAGPPLAGERRRRDPHRLAGHAGCAAARPRRPHPAGRSHPTGASI